MGINPVDIGEDWSEKGASMLDEAAQSRTAEGDFVEFALAGAAAKGEYHCSSCGYGVTVHARLPQCPMCAGTTWEPAEWTGFARQQYQA